MGNFDNYYLTPSGTTHINHRSECVPYYGAFWSDEAGGWSLSGAYLPIFTAPMSSIIDENNYLTFDWAGINTIVPRTVSYDKRMEIAKKLIWVALGLDEFKRFISEHDTLEDEYRICVDVANGHMKSLIDLCAEAKKKFGDNLVLMAGNIANPYTYIKYWIAGIDYVRVGIGTGQACATNDKTGIGCSLPILISRIYDIKKTSSITTPAPKIVADGGMSSIRDIIIALAFGADYVMCGKIFAQCKEACGEVIHKQIEQEDSIIKTYYSQDEEDGNDFKYIDSRKRLVMVPGRMFYGMSTERAQEEMGNSVIKHSEGKEYWVPIEYTLDEWVKDFTKSIESAMSYCNSEHLEEFIGSYNLPKF